MQQRAHAPYSSFFVGAALETDEQTIIGGCNIESASYGLTMCAERVALFQALSQGFKNFTSLVLVSDSGAYPCGACRQLLYEFAPDASIIIATPSKIIEQTSVKLLFPHAFCNKNLALQKKGSNYE